MGGRMHKQLVTISFVYETNQQHIGTTFGPTIGKQFIDSTLVVTSKENDISLAVIRRQKSAMWPVRCTIDLHFSIHLIFCLQCMLTDVYSSLPPSVCLFVCPSIAFPPACLSLFVSESVHSYFFVSVCLSFCLCLSSCLSVRVSVSISITCSVSV